MWPSRCLALLQLWRPPFLFCDNRPFDYAFNCVDDSIQIPKFGLQVVNCFSDIHGSAPPSRGFCGCLSSRSFGTIPYSMKSQFRLTANRRAFRALSRSMTAFVILCCPSGCGSVGASAMMALTIRRASVSLASDERTSRLRISIISARVSVIFRVFTSQLRE